MLHILIRPHGKISVCASSNLNVKHCNISFQFVPFLFISIPKRHGLYPRWINSENGQICIQEARHWKRTSTQKRLNPLTFATHVVPTAKRIFTCSLASHNWCRRKDKWSKFSTNTNRKLQYIYIVITLTCAFSDFFNGKDLEI